MDDNCGECVECMGVASGGGEQEAGVASGSGWNLFTGGSRGGPMGPGPPPPPWPAGRPVHDY